MKHKRAIIYFISFFSLSVMFSTCYYLSYRHALNDFNKKAVERNESLEKMLAENSSKLQEENEAIHNLPEENNVEDVADSSVQVDSIEMYTIKPSTVYKLQVSDIKTGNNTEEILPIPSYLIGLTRQEVIDYLNDYSMDLPLSEFEKGLISYELTSFNEDEIILKKTYNEDEIEYKYFLISENGYIVAYYGDQKTVFDYTSVSVENLPEIDKQELEEGILVKDLEQLYGLLENYSS